MYINKYNKYTFNLFYYMYYIKILYILDVGYDIDLATGIDRPTKTYR